jgi:hypothetical protein
MSFHGGRKPNFVGKAVGIPVESPAASVQAGSILGLVDRGGVHEHDRDIILNGVNTAADAAFQALSVSIQNDRLFTDRADQHVQQILRDHSGFDCSAPRRVGERSV